MGDLGVAATGAPLALDDLAIGRFFAFAGRLYLTTIYQRFVDDKGKHWSQSVAPTPTVRAPVCCGGRRSPFNLQLELS
jgi:hypothetical protein